MRTPPVCSALLFALAACEGGPITEVAPRSEARETGNGLEIHVTVDPADAALAELLGWEDGVPGARVMILVNGTARWDTLVADASGRVAVPGVSSGLHRIYAERSLTAEEQTLVGEPRAFGDGIGVYPSGETVVALRLYADRPGSLVLSEVGNGSPPPWETGGSYLGGLYFEIYNNGDAVQYLDGMLFGSGSGPYHNSVPNPCPTTESVRRDSLGIYARRALAFPGAGTDYPIYPGETRLVAAQAIDHRPVHPTLLDLRHADFEIGGEGAADNPDVPNMLDLGLDPFSWNFLLATLHFYFVATPQDLRSLPISFRLASGTGYPRIPRETIVDAAAMDAIWPLRDAEQRVPCQPKVHPVFDRYEGGMREIGFDTDPLFSAVRGLQRRALRRAADGRIILMNTNTSAVDFEHVFKTPGWVPEP